MQVIENNDYDIIVVGGGVAGVSAALASARQGKKVLLIEKSYVLGGLGTSGLVTVYLPLCDGMGHQVSFGIAEELLRLSIKDAYEDRYPTPWLKGGSIEEKTKKRFLVQYNPHLYAIACENLLERKEVDILYGCFVTDTIVENDRIKYVVLENISGRYVYGCTNVIDASGDGVLAYKSGEDVVEFKQGNVLAAWYYSLSEEEGYKLNILGAADNPDDEKTGEEEYLCDKRFKGLDAKEISKMVSLSHKAIYDDFKKRRACDHTFLPVNIASIPQIRMTRGLKGKYLMSVGDDKKSFSDSVGLFSNWKKSGPVYELPFRALHGTKIKNLLACGRAMGAEDSMWDVTRVIPVCAVTGEACGVASALGDWDKISVSDIQVRLRENGVKLKIEEVI